jgi:hypothetical protein
MREIYNFRLFLWIFDFFLDFLMIFLYIRFNKLAITTVKEEKVMGVDYSSVLVVGLSQDELIQEIISERQVPVFNRRTGQQEGSESEKSYKYIVGTTEVPDDDSPTNFLLEHGLEYTAYIADSEAQLFGKILSIVYDEGPCYREVELTGTVLVDAIAEVAAIFKTLGVEAVPKLYHAICAS